MLVPGHADETSEGLGFGRYGSAPCSAQRLRRREGADAIPAPAAIRVGIETCGAICDVARVVIKWSTRGDRQRFSRFRCRCISHRLDRPWWCECTGAAELKKHELSAKAALRRMARVLRSGVCSSLRGCSKFPDCTLRR